MAEQLKLPLPVTQASYRSELLFAFWLLCFQTQLSANASGKSEDWAPATHVGSQDGVPGFWLWSIRLL